jgi:hypothetical protein
VARNDRRVGETPGLYAIRIRGRLGPTALSAFPALTSTLQGGETVLTGLLEDRSALFGVLGQIEALGLDLIEVRPLRATPQFLPTADQRAVDGPN